MSLGEWVEQNVVDALHLLAATEQEAMDHLHLESHGWIWVKKVRPKMKYTAMSLETINICVQNNTKHISSQECKQKRYALNTSEWLAKVRDEDIRTRKEKQYLERTWSGGTGAPASPSGNSYRHSLHSTQGCVGKMCDSWLSKGKKSVLVHGVCWLPRWNSSHCGWFLSQPLVTHESSLGDVDILLLCLLDGALVSRWSISWLIILQ